MDKFNHYFGIDISKDVFDLIDNQGVHRQFENQLSGFKKFLKIIPENALCVMEATGVYHQCLALFLFEAGIPVSVVNPLRIKRFIEMNLRRNKTDKADAEMICQFAINQEIELWSPPEEYIQKSKLIYEHLSIFIKSRTMFKNRLHATERQPVNCNIVVRKLKQTLRQLDQSIKELEDELELLIKANQANTLTLLKQIPGLGTKTAIMLILLTEGFTKFDTSKQFSNFVGMAPIHRQSGTSVKGKSRISKQGNPAIRNLLFMCSFNACKCNRACKLLFDRIVAKGKSKKLALIAVANKLIKQAFGIVKSGLSYDPEYVSTKPKI